MNKQLGLILSIIVFSIFYFFDIGNPDGMRQGTESLYLQVSKEMYEANSYLTPLYLGEHHWSKPPLQFWMPFPLYSMFGGYEIGLARGVIALLALASSLFYARWMKKHFNVSFIATLVIFLGSLGFLKYSRTFMFETALAVLSSIGTMLFFDYLEERKKRHLFIGSLILGLSVLIKGPVSLVMAGFAVVLYQVYLMFTQSRWIIKETFIYFFLATLVGSLWYLMAFAEYGMDFFNYFFVRENLGKFDQEPMPLSRIFAGILVYALPWTFYLLSFGRINSAFTKQTEYRAKTFITLCFIAFFVLWMIPAQRSLHYAIPSLPFFLMLVALTTKGMGHGFNKAKSYIFTKLGLIAFNIIIGIVFGAAAFLSAGFVKYLLIFGVILVALNISLIARKPYAVITLFVQASIVGFLWSIIIPNFYIPNIPVKEAQMVVNKKVALADRRAYFYTEAIGSHVDAINANEIKTYLDQPDSYVVVYESRLGGNKIEDYEVVSQWYKWIRKVDEHDIVRAFKAHDINELKEDVYLIKKKSE